MTAEFLAYSKAAGNDLSTPIPQYGFPGLKPGDRVTTTGGIRGTILSIKEDVIQLRVPPDNLRIEVLKSAIGSVTQDEAK